MTFHQATILMNGFLVVLSVAYIHRRIVRVITWKITMTSRILLLATSIVRYPSFCQSFGCNHGRIRGALHLIISQRRKSSTLHHHKYAIGQHAWNGASAVRPSLFQNENHVKYQLMSCRYYTCRRTVSSVSSLSTYLDDDNDDDNLRDDDDVDDGNQKWQHPKSTQDEQQVMKGQEKRLFQVTAKYQPAGDQPEAIYKLTNQLNSGNRFSILQGITGTGKTLVMSHLIANCNKPCLVLCHNKTLAAQLARELRSFLRKNAVEFFVSYYNHYVPESYSETTGKYIAKKSSINTDIDILRHRATRSLLTRDDVVIVSSVSCIYGLGLPEEYLDSSFEISKQQIVSYTDFVGKLRSMLYEEVVADVYNYDDESNIDDGLVRGKYEVRDESLSSSEVVKIIVVWPPHDKFPMQIQLQSIDSISSKIHSSANSESTSNGLGMVGNVDNDTENDDFFRVVRVSEGHPNGLTDVESTRIFPAKHHVTSDERVKEACIAIEEELSDRMKELKADGKHQEADRLQKRVLNDEFMMRETGFCSGGENYSRHLGGREAGSPPFTLLDYLCTSRDGASSRDWLLIVDESHVTIPQVSSMYEGDRARKRSLIKHGYRLPSALDNRPLKGNEFWDRVQQAIFASATPNRNREMAWSTEEPVEMVIRPTHVCDPVIEIRPKKGQLEDLLQEITKRSALGNDGEKNFTSRTLVTTLTKRDAEDLSAYLNENNIKSTFIHSSLTTHQRSNALKALQNGEIDCLVGVNLLREGLDLPQVSLVAILNADSEGFLRCETSLLQTVGRAARNIDGTAIFYADRTTDSMQKCIDATNRRRARQIEYNEKFGYKMQSTKGSSVLSIFDLLKDQIDSEMALEVVRGKDGNAGTKVSTSISPKTDIASSTINVPLKSSKNDFVTDHIPNNPGVYFWKSADGTILYIGKSNKLRNRIKSYLSTNINRHSLRIKTMLEKAKSVEFILTPSDRDALILESNLIKYHQPNFNVLLKDDEHYPYICASVGDSIPRLFVVPQKHEKTASNKDYRYYGPYTSMKEVNEILDEVEKKYDLRAQAFLVRHGSTSKQQYCELFNDVVNDFSTNHKRDDEKLVKLRSMYEEAGLLFDSKYSKCRDVVSFSRIETDDAAIIIHLIQLRDGMVAGSYSYECRLPFGISADADYSDAIQTVLLKRHYPCGPTHHDQISWFPDDILIPIELTAEKDFKAALRHIAEDSDVKKSIRVSTVHTKKGSRQLSDARALEFATKNANQIAFERSRKVELLPELHDGSAAKDLADLLLLKEAPTRIECFDISHTQGLYPVASRVVFINGKPAPHLYRIYNIRPDSGGDDYASMEEVLERRFRRLKQMYEGTIRNDESWSRPDLIVIDGGKGQLTAALKGIGKHQYDDDAIAVCALAKNEELIFVPGRKAPVNKNLDSASPAMLLVRALRDESHRFALNAHRKRRSLQYKSALKN